MEVECSQRVNENNSIIPNTSETSIHDPATRYQCDVARCTLSRNSFSNELMRYFAMLDISPYTLKKVKAMQQQAFYFISRKYVQVQQKGLEIGEITTVQTYMRLSLSRNYFESYAHARELNIQSHTANCPTRLVTLAHNRSSSILLSHLPRDTSTYGHQQYRILNYCGEITSSVRRRPVDRGAAQVLFGDTAPRCVSPYDIREPSSERALDRAGTASTVREDRSLRINNRGFGQGSPVPI
ncbi:hypothetical protein NQ318_001637 [Aromia moschata]|uniref:Uncharacterized protein n=1 Tax=Aromia moschata TaxID=1265417 RepID=A0AAV8Y2R9_9CUCU|nr:hypothetical protein NQ318_001637 [Aromia moschata]